MADAPASGTGAAEARPAIAGAPAGGEAAAPPAVAAPRGGLRPRPLAGLRPGTQAVQAGVGLDLLAGGISVPVYRSATFIHPAYGVSTGFDYSRLGNPTRRALEDAVAAAEGGCRALAFPSGMAAIAALRALLRPGDRVLATADLYGHTYRLLRDVWSADGIRTEFVDTSDPEEVARAAAGGVRAIFVETPTNPMLRVADIRALAEIARGHGALLIVDNTLMTWYLQQPLLLGADVVVYSATKYLGGHNDVLGGLLVARDPGVAERLAEHQILTGAVLSPDDAWLVLRGMKTLHLRMRRHEENALRIAEWLLSRPEVERVYYPGLPDHPGYAVMRAQARGFGGMVSFVLRRIDLVERLLSGVRVIAFAESLGGVESLMTHPAAQTHRDIPPERRRALGLSDRLVRLSVGIEDAEDLIDDLRQALEG